MDINFELYKIFYYAAKHTSFSDAAEKLYVSQSAVSQSIKNLEQKLGVHLFFRKTRNIKLTSEGELLFKHVEQAFNFLKTAENKIYESQNLVAGEICIGVSDTICKYFLVPYLERFIQLYPKIKIKVINRTSYQIVEILKNGTIDFGIVTLPIHERNIATYEFKTVEDIFVTSEKFDFLKGKVILLKDLVKYPLLMLKQGSATRYNLDYFLKSSGISVTPEIELESVDLLAEFARIGLGIAHVLRESVEHSIRIGELFEVQTFEKLPGRKLGIITVSDVPLSRTSDAFIKLLSSTVKA